MAPAVRVLAGASRPKVTSSQAMSCWHRKLRWRPTSVPRWPWLTNFRCQRVDEIRFSIAEPERFPAKHALGLDPGVETGSRQENASNQESRAPFPFHRNGALAIGLIAPDGRAEKPADEVRGRVGKRLWRP